MTAHRHESRPYRKLVRVPPRGIEETAKEKFMRLRDVATLFTAALSGVAIPLDEEVMNDVINDRDYLKNQLAIAARGRFAAKINSAREILSRYTNEDDRKILRGADRIIEIARKSGYDNTRVNFLFFGEDEKGYGKLGAVNERLGKKFDEFLALRDKKAVNVEPKPDLFKTRNYAAPPLLSPSLKVTPPVVVEEYLPPKKTATSFPNPPATPAPDLVSYPFLETKEPKLPTYPPLERPKPDFKPEIEPEPDPDPEDVALEDPKPFEVVVTAPEPDFEPEPELDFGPELELEPDPKPEIKPEPEDVVTLNPFFRVKKPEVPLKPPVDIALEDPEPFEAVVTAPEPDFEPELELDPNPEPEIEPDPKPEIKPEPEDVVTLNPFFRVKKPEVPLKPPVDVDLEGSKPSKPVITPTLRVSPPLTEKEVILLRHAEQIGKPAKDFGDSDFLHAVRYNMPYTMEGIIASQNLIQMGMKGSVDEAKKATAETFTIYFNDRKDNPLHLALENKNPETLRIIFRDIVMQLDESKRMSFLNKRNRDYIDGKGQLITGKTPLEMASQDSEMKAIFLENGIAVPDLVSKKSHDSGVDSLSLVTESYMGSPAKELDVKRKTFEDRFRDKLKRNETLKAPSDIFQPTSVSQLASSVALVR